MNEDHLYKELEGYLTRDEAKRLLKSRVSFIYSPLKIDIVARNCTIEPDNKISLYYTLQDKAVIAVNHLHISRPFRDSLDDPWLMDRSYIRFSEFKKLNYFKEADSVAVRKMPDDYYFMQYDKYIDYMKGRRWPIFLMSDDDDYYMKWAASGKPVYQITPEFMTMANDENLLCSDELVKFPHEAFLLMFSEGIPVPFVKGGLIEGVFINDGLISIIGTEGRKWPKFIKMINCELGDDTWLSFRYFTYVQRYTGESEVALFAQKVAVTISGLLYLLTHPINQRIVSQKNSVKEDAPFTIWNVEPSIRKPIVPNGVISSTPIIRRGPLDKSLYILGATKQKGYTRKNGTWVEPIDTTRWFLPENLLPRLR